LERHQELNMKKNILILFLLVCFISSSKAAEGTRPWSIPKVNNGNIDYIATPADSKMKVVYPFYYSPFSGSYYPSYVFTKAELEKIKTYDSKATSKNIKMIDCNGAIGQGVGSVCAGYVYKNDVLLKSAACYKFDGSATMSAGVLIDKITFNDDGEAFGDIYVYNRVSISGMPVQLVGNQLPLKDYSIVAGASSNRAYYPGGYTDMGAVSLTYYFEPASIKGEINATKDKKSVRAVRPGEKVDINWSATKN
jgi:hypothetical protein